ncbi:hypothetical protein DFP72DRAFT_855495 [Ephemerocybe angulata]|uniref:Uncharacterized protein n=1 Tax=Ephemerocybe angulata TaxID=980116 RepID=A0A8H6HIA7_9AGAR|nr:hypothetical protein DFP72DRAFT_855495 [Tulosesus angulatus]
MCRRRLGKLKVAWFQSISVQYITCGHIVKLPEDIVYRSECWIVPECNEPLRIFGTMDLALWLIRRLYTIIIYGEAAPFRPRQRLCVWLFVQRKFISLPSPLSQLGKCRFAIMKRLDESKHVYPAKRQRLAITAAATAGVESSTLRTIADLDINQEVIGKERTTDTTQKRTSTRAARPQAKLSPLALRTRAQRKTPKATTANVSKQTEQNSIAQSAQAEGSPATSSAKETSVTFILPARPVRHSSRKAAQMVKGSTAISAVVPAPKHRHRLWNDETQGPPPMRKAQMKAAAAPATVDAANPVPGDTPVAEGDSEDTDSDATDIEETATGGEPQRETLAPGEAYQATISLTEDYHRRAALFKPTSEIQDHAEEDIVSAICLIQLSASEGLGSPLESEDRDESSPKPQVLHGRNRAEITKVTDSGRA